MATTPDARLKEIMAAAVKHLHAFARDVNLTPAEWIKGIEFMTEVGQMCSPERQEFILLSDTMGLSALVNGLHDKTAIEEGTHTSLLGPFYRETTPTLAPGSQIAKKVKPGTECALYGRITDVNGKPLAGATVSVWQTGADGLYDIQESATEVDYRGVFTTDADGRYHLRTVKPIGYSIPMDGPVGALVKAQGRHGMRPAHIHFLVGASRLSRARHRAVPARRSAPRRRRGVRLVGRSRGRHRRERSELPDQGTAEHPLRPEAGARERGRQDERPRRCRSRGDHEADGNGSGGIGTASRLSCPAKAGHPVTRSASNSDTLRVTGSPGQAAAMTTQRNDNITTGPQPKPGAKYKKQNTTGFREDQ